MSVYSKVPINKPGRNAYNLSHSFKGSLNIGELVPIARPMECVPGDTFITGNITEVELNPIVTNFKGELYFETWQFFVSNDMLYQPADDSGKFTEILASMQTPQNILPLPYFGNSNYSFNRDYYTYLYGIKTMNSDLNIIEYPLRGVFKIINEWFKDENLESDYSAYAFYHINYKKDRYTSAFLNQQKGNPIRLPLGEAAPLFVRIDGQTNLTGLSSSNTSPLIGFYDGSIASNINKTKVGNVITTGQTPDLVNPGIMFADLSMASAATINDLRLANKLQKWLEKLQLCGSRIKEFLLSQYGVTPNDETLQRPVLIGHTKVPVVVNEIIANIKATNKSGQIFQNSQGSRGGEASAMSSFKYGKWFCKEFGWIITLGALRPKAVYTGGIHKSLTRDSVIDFWNPVFEHLGQQAVKNKELYISGTPQIDNGVFGFQDIYNEMRHLEDFIAPDMLNSGFQTKNIYRSFASTPTISRSFIEVKPTDYDYLFDVPSSTAPQAFFNSSNIVKAVRPLSKRSIPSL